MDIRKTERGFGIVEFQDANGKNCSLQKSSSAMEDKIWLGVCDANPLIMVSKAKQYGLTPPAEGVGWIPYPIPEDVLLTTRMHLNREQVRELLPYLIEFIQHGELNRTPLDCEDGDENPPTEILLPNKLTYENGAKTALMGEFYETVEISKESYCDCGDCDYCEEFEDEEHSIHIKVPIRWQTIKGIYSTIVNIYGKK